MINIIGNIIGTNSSGSQAPPPSPLLTDLVSYWRMDDGAGVSPLVDIHGGKNASVTGSLGSEAGKIGNALIFDGTNDYADVANNADLNPTAAITVQAWVKLVGTSTQSIISKLVADGSHNSPFFGWSLQIQNIRTPRFWVALTDRTSGDVVSGAQINTGVWAHLVGRYQSGELAIFVNGTKTLDATPGSGTLLQYTTPVRIGANGALGEKLNGSLDELAVWKRVLSDSEVAQLYNSGNGLSYPFN